MLWQTPGWQNLKGRMALQASMRGWRKEWCRENCGDSYRCINVLHAGSAAPGRGGGQAKGKEIWVDAETGSKDEGEEPAAAREDFDPVAVSLLSCSDQGKTLVNNINVCDSIGSVSAYLEYKCSFRVQMTCD